MLESFGFQKRALGQAALRCEVIGSIQKVEGVAYVDVDTFGGIPEELDPKELCRKVKSIVNPDPGAPPAPEPVVKPAGFYKGVLHSAQLAIFLPAVPETIVLNQIK